MNDPLGRTLARQRMRRVLPHVRGRLLDIGCGANELVRAYRSSRGSSGDDVERRRASIGVDVFPWEGVDAVVEDTREMPFEDASFDTATIVAALNHIPYREEALAEVHRVVRPGGRLILTMIPPGISRVWHLLRRPWDDDQSERGMVEGEVWGLTRAGVQGLVEGAGFRVVHEERFMAGINRLTVAERPDGAAGPA